MTVSADRWSCPRCGRTIALCEPLPPAVLRQALQARRVVHEQAHALADMVRAELTPPGTDSG